MEMGSKSTCVAKKQGCLTVSHMRWLCLLLAFLVPARTVQLTALRAVRQSLNATRAEWRNLTWYERF